MSDRLAAAFPPSVHEAVAAVVRVLERPATDAMHAFSVEVEGCGRVEIPYRIYNREPSRDTVDTLDERQRDVLSCLYTRHSNGYTRQRHLRTIVTRTHSWVVPFVVQLVGEYVVEILHDIKAGLGDLGAQGSRQRSQYGWFIVNNPDYFKLTSERVQSYWDAYYRHRYPSRSDYPGFALLTSLEAAAHDIA